MSPIEIIALIVAILIVLKTVILIAKPKAIIVFSKKLLAHSGWLRFVYLALAVLVGSYLLQNMRITQIAAVMLFASLLMRSLLVHYPGSMMKLAKEAMTKTDWLAVLLMLLLAFLILFDLFIVV